MLELEVVELVTNAETVVEIDSALPEVTVDITKSISVEVQPDTYVLTSDGIYTGRLTTAVPTWLIAAMQQLLTTGTGNVTDAIQELRDALDLLEIGVSQHTTSIQTTNESFNTLETSVVSRLGINEAAILDIYTTKVDAAGASAVAAQVISSTFGGNADAYIANIASTYTNASSATALNIEQLYASYNNTAVSITALDEVVVKQANVYSQPADPSLDVLITLKIGDYWIDTDHPTRQGYQWNGISWDLASDDAVSRAVVWSANSSKLITDPDGNITGWAMSDSSTTESAFTVYAENFKITDGTTGYTPFQISGGTVYIGEVDTSTPQITSIGSYTSAPVATAVNQVYKNTTDGNTYLWNGTSWVLWLEKGEIGPAGLTGPIGETGSTGSRGAGWFQGTASSWSDATANAVISDLGLVKVLMDKVTLSSGTFAETKYWSGSSWITAALYVNGNLIVSGTILTDAIAANAITAAKINVSDLFAQNITATGQISGITLTGSYGAFTKQVTTSGYKSACFVDGGVEQGLTAINNSFSTAIQGRNIGAGVAVLGVAGSGTGVRGEGTGKGVEGSTSSGIGINGIASTGYAVNGEASSSGIGVRGYSASGFGLYTPSPCWFEGAAYPFTGAHVVFTNMQMTQGDIVDAVYAMGMSVENSYVEGKPTVSAKSTRVFGVYNRVMPEDFIAYLDTNEYTNDKVIVDGVEVFTVKPEYAEYVQALKDNGYYRVGVNAIGEGMINVCSYNDDIIAGDYICSSAVTGKGMKQDDGILHNYTVAKALEGVLWDTEIVGENGCYVIDGYKCKMIACTYHSG